MSTQAPAGPMGDIQYGGPPWWLALEPLNYQSRAYEIAASVKSGPGYLYGFEVYSSLGSAQFILVFDSAGAPPANFPAATVFTVGASSNLPINWLPPRTFHTGIYITNSTTAPTLTAGAANCHFDVQYR